MHYECALYNMKNVHEFFLQIYVCFLPSNLFVAVTIVLALAHLSLANSSSSHTNISAVLKCETTALA